jgi:predicted helicase
VTNHIHDYYKSVCEAYRLGNDESLYTKPIITLLSQFGCIARDTSSGRKQQKSENTDIKLWREGAVITEIDPFAALEIKKINKIEKSAVSQVKAQAALHGYAILTNNLGWQFWQADKNEMTSGVELIEIVNGELVLMEDRVELFVSLVKNFLLQDPTQVKSSNKLAEYMAIHAKNIRSVITGILKEGKDKLPLVNEKQKRLPMFVELYGLFSKIKEELRPLLDTRSFADMYAQTIVYGLFIARYNDSSSTTFDRYKAIGKLQEESALLNRFFTHITSTGKKHPTLDDVIDKLCSLYQICDISTLLKGENHGDTIVHFYENFLTYYDPELRKSLGVFYTPYQVVRYMVSMVDKLLVEDFNIKGGLSNNDQMPITVPTESYKVGGKTRNNKKITVPSVAILDPACGTGTFHAEIIKYIKNTYFSGAKSVFYKDYILSENGLLSRIVGFEIMMTSYVVAHLKIRRTIYETLDNSPETLTPTNVYLTNTLMPPNTDFEQDSQMTLFDFSAAISDEAYKADTWKTRRPIKVIIGNPPYLSKSKNPFDISAYRTETDGITDFGEKKHNLNDDYVKFFRFSEQIINKNDEGILAFVSNNGFLDNPTFRGMRASLLRTFDKIFVVNLHGSAVKKEIPPNGGKDENVFNIMQGVSLFIAIKATTNSDWAKVYHCDLWGKREDKFRCLERGALDFVELNLDRKMAYFVPLANGDKEIYDKGVCIADLFPMNASGIVSGRDDVAIAATRGELERRIDIVKNATNEEPIRELWGKFASGQTAERIQNDVLSADGIVTPITFRPFDKRWTFFTGRSNGFVSRPLGNVSKYLIKSYCGSSKDNIGMVFTKGDSTPNNFSMIFISSTLIDNRLTAAQTAGYAQVAPLYVYSELEDEWQPNFNNTVLTQLIEYMSFTPTEVEVFDYIYGILYDPIYRERFNEFLKRDFPRVPIINAPKDSENDFCVSDDMFRAYVKAGEELRKLHLMQTTVSTELSLEPNIPDDLEIGSIKYKDGVLHLNANKRIHGIPEDVWNYRIGGYQVLDKWFKSHKGETMSIDDFSHIEAVVGLLGETIKLQDELKNLHN